VGRTVVAVERQRVDDAVVAVGSVQPRRRADVASQLLANIREIKVRPGDRVAAQAVLVVLDDRELLAQQREATAAAAVAEADLVTRKGELERARVGFKTGVVTREDYDRIAGAVRVGEAQLQRSKEQIARLDVQLTHTRIAAGTAGIVADRFAEPGDVATPGKPILSVYDPSDLELHANVPESLAANVAVGRKIEAQIDAANISALGEVREVVPQAQQASRTILVKVAVPNSTSTSILPGMFGRISIPIGQTDRLLVPSAAVRSVGQLELVDVVDPDNTLTRRFIRTGRKSEGRVEVLSGLSEGESVAMPSVTGHKP
jgi:RND family efflux transporter MFP subunit